jgi:hypothetical protein
MMNTTISLDSEAGLVGAVDFMAHHSRRNRIKRAGADKCQNNFQPLMGTDFLPQKSAKSAKNWWGEHTREPLPQPSTLNIFELQNPLSETGLRRNLTASVKNKTTRAKL